MNHLTEFQRNTVVIGVRKLMNENHFFISDFNDLIQATDGYISHEDYAALRRLHCVRWCNMPHELREQVRQIIFKSLRIEELESAVRQQPRDVTPAVPTRTYAIPTRIFQQPITPDEIEPSALKRKWAAIKRVFSA